MGSTAPAAEAAATGVAALVISRVDFCRRRAGRRSPRADVVARQTSEYRHPGPGRRGRECAPRPRPPQPARGWATSAAMTRRLIIGRSPARSAWRARRKDTGGVSGARASENRRPGQAGRIHASKCTFRRGTESRSNRVIVELIQRNDVFPARARAGHHQQRSERRARAASGVTLPLAAPAAAEKPRIRWLSSASRSRSRTARRALR